jgi:hypothetical protein
MHCDYSVGPGFLAQVMALVTGALPVVYRAASGSKL